MDWSMFEAAEENGKTNEIGCTEIAVDDQRGITGGSWLSWESGAILTLAVVAGIAAAPEILVVGAVAGGYALLSQ